MKTAVVAPTPITSESTATAQCNRSRNRQKRNRARAPRQSTLFRATGHAGSFDARRAVRAWIKRHDVRAVHHGALLPQLSVEPRERQRRCLEMLRRLYGEAGHDLTLEVRALPGLVLHYTAFHQILADVSDARVYGGIHFRFDQEAGDHLGREVATFVIKEYLRPLHGQ